MPKNNKGKMNLLAHSGSPYLLQHATNPVDWHPWGPEAFERAKHEDKPVFLSTGYSTCHWCHVMEKESFSDREVAALMNEAFVCIKVDREERPDVDHLYMTVCQLLTGSGGWPLTIVMTPDQKPFFAGTYFPRDERYGRPGMMQIIPKIRELWENERETLNTSAEEIAEGVKAFMAPDPVSTPSQGLPARTYKTLKEQFDSRHGGFGSAPKFPVFSNLLFLLNYWHRTGEEQALSMVIQTLEAIRMGGIFDHMGYGLHRYSTDERWFAPHFEKMLYDQALAVLTCSNAFLAAGEEKFREMAEEIIAYVLRDLTSPEGGFYSAEDADSEGEEGKFYTWTAADLNGILDKEEMQFVTEVYNITDAGNFLTETGEPTGRNILYIKESINSPPGHPGLKHLDHEGTGTRIREKLMAARSDRIRPMRDEKIMTDWNGLMIAALARAAGAFGDERYKEAAEKAFTLIRTNMIDKDGSLLHLRYDDNNTVPAFLDDYAYLLWGLLELYQVSFKTDHLVTALQLASEMVDLFQDPENGGFFLARRESDPSFSNLKPSFDGPMPTGNAVAAMSLLRLGRLAARQDLEEAGLATFSAFAADMTGNPSGFTHMISAMETGHNGTVEVVIAGNLEEDDTRQMVQAIHRSFLPGVTCVVVDPDDPDPDLGELLPFTSGMKTLNGRAAAYVCRNYTCQAPTTDPQEMLKGLGRKGMSGS